MVTYTTGELARRAGVSQRTIRYYEELGLIQSSSRLAGGRRLFTEDALQRLRFIRRLKKVGISLDEMHYLNGVFTMKQSTNIMLEEVDVLLKNHLNRIEQQRRDLDQVELDIKSFRRQIQLRLTKPSKILS